jgi:hypothetical protein
MPDYSTLRLLVRENLLSEAAVTPRARGTGRPHFQGDEDTMSDAGKLDFI